MSRQKTKKETHSLPLQKAGTNTLGAFKTQALILVFIGFVFYANSFWNQYALDDGIVIQKNDHVQDGFRGIPKILSTDALSLKGIL